MGNKNFLKGSLMLATAGTMAFATFPIPAVRAATSIPTLTYSAHVPVNGWMDAVTATGDENTPYTGTVGKSRLADGFKINLEGIDGVKLKYSVHNRQKGWSEFVDENIEAGEIKTEGLSNADGWKQAEAVKITVAEGYDKLKEAGYEIRYRVHLGYDGWEKEWTVADNSKTVINKRTENSQTGKDANGNKVIAGSVGWSRRIEALQVMLVKTKQEPEVPAYNYNITINENNIINNINQEDLNVKVTFDKEVAKDTSLKLVAFDESGKKLSINGLNETTVTNPDETNNDKKEMKVTTSGDKKIDMTKDEKEQADLIGGYPHILDGTIYFRLFDAKDTKYATPLGEVKVTKNTVEPLIARVSAERSNTDNATFKATKYGKSDVKTIYYCAVPNNVIKTGYTGDPVKWDTKTKKFSKSSTNVNESEYTPVTKTITVNGDSIEEIISGLGNSNSYKIYYIVENSYGSQTIVADDAISLPHVDMANDASTTKEEKIANITLPTSVASDTNKFSWSNPHNESTINHGYIVTLYKDGEIYHEEIAGRNEFELRNYNDPTTTLEAGEYYITVVTKGDIADSTKATVNSEVVTSEKVTVKAVSPVSNIKLTTDESNGYPRLSWDENDANCGGYTVKLYLEDKDTGVFGTTARITSTTTKSENKSIYYATETGKEEYPKENWTGERKLDRNYGYYAEVVATVNGEKTKEESEKNKEKNTIYVDSQPEYYYFCAPYREADITSTTDNSMTFKLGASVDSDSYLKGPYNGNVCVYGEKESDLTYSVRVYKVQDDESKTDMGTKKVETNYETDEEGKVTATYFTVNGLEANTKYEFRLITKCGEFEGWSKVISNGHTMPRVKELTCEDKTEECKKGTNTFFAESNGNSIKIDGVEYTAKDFNNEKLKNEFIGLKSFLSKLKAGDKVTITGNVIDLMLNSSANGADDASFMYSDFLEGKVLNITGNSNERKIGKPTGEVNSMKYPAEVNLKGGQFDLTAFKKGKNEVVTLGNGVKIKTGTDTVEGLKVVSGAEVTVNNVKMKTSLETVINTKTQNSNGVELTVVANGEESNNLVFENLNNSVDGSKTDGNVKIKFVSSNGTSTTQQGSITIKGNGGKVTITQDSNVTVGSDIVVKVEKGEVDIASDKLTGGKTITLTAASKDNETTAKIEAIAETAAPDVLKGKTIEIKEYTIDTLRTALNNNVSQGVEITENVLNEVNAWLSKFGVTVEKVTVTVNSSNGTKVTIENSGESSVEVEGIK